GVAYVRGMELGNGTIEFDVRGKDVQGQSFVGVAFHGVDGTTYDAIYFRPFNFSPADSARHSHAVQYISHPTFTWQKLRTERPGLFERPVSPAPDPNGWFHVRVGVASPKVSVFVGDAKEPSLVVDLLSDRTQGLVGLWVGNGSGGDCADLKIIPHESATGAPRAGPANSLMERPWLAHYDDGVPATLAPHPEKNLVGVRRAPAAERPRHPAVLFKGARLSYGELDGLSDALAAWLAARGVGKGDR